MGFYNYVVPKLSSSLNQGHLSADLLLDAIKKHDGSEAYHSMFDMWADPKPESFTGFRGQHRPAMGWVIFDFDSSKEKGVVIENFKIEDAFKELNTLWGGLNLSLDFARVFFSGRTGFHLYIREEFFGVHHSEHCAHEYANIASELKKKFNLKTLDVGIYTANHKIRFPNSLNPKSGMYKTEWNKDNLNDITDYAKTKPMFVHLDWTPIEIPHRYVRESKAASTQGPKASDFGMDVSLEVHDGSLFKQFKDKKCVEKMWVAELSEGERHAIGAILIADCFHTGLPQNETETRLREWTVRQGIADRFEKEFLRMIEEQYQGKRDYSYGCYHNIKKKFCSGTCGLYLKLDPEKRAVVNDLPPEAQKIVEEQSIPGERRIARDVLDSFKGQIIKQDKDLFIYRNTHWTEASQVEIDAIKEMLFQRLGRKAKSKDMESAFKTFLHSVPAVPHGVNMFELNPNAANFKNGTLWVKRLGGVYSLEFKSHNQNDYLTSCLDVDYTPHTGSVNTKFSEYLEHLLKGDPELDDKMRALKQMAGAMLMPRFPQIFFLLGESGSGKSTFVRLFFRLIGGAKVCGFVQPRDMYGFHLEGLIHKTINVHTDVDEHEKIPDSFFKASGDRIPVQINRKGKKVVQSMLPAVHVFCANTMPPTAVKNQNVYNRRMVILKVDNIVEKRIDQFEDLVFEESTQALVEFALEGLRDIVSSGGFYFKPNSSRQLTTNWQAQASDAIADFIDSITHKEVSGILLEQNNAMPRNRVFDKFATWAIEQGYREVPFKAARFYRELENRGFRLKKVKGERMIEGFSGAPGPENEGGSFSEAQPEKDNF